MTNIKDILPESYVFYVLVPIGVAFLNFARDWFNIKMSDNKMAKARMRPKISYDYDMFVIEILCGMFISNIVSSGAEVIFRELLKSELLAQYFRIWTYVLFSLIVIYFMWKKATIKLVFLKNRTKKIVLSVLYYLINFIMTFWNEFVNESWLISSICGIACGLLYIWVKQLVPQSIFTIKNAFADVYVNGTETIMFVMANTIRKKGKWVEMKRYGKESGEIEHILVLEKNIIRVDYWDIKRIFIVDKEGIREV